MILRQNFDIMDLRNRGFLEPGEVLKRKELFLAVEQQPNPVLRDLRDFNFRSVCAKRL